MIFLLLICCLTAPAEITIDADTITLGALIPFPSPDARDGIAFGYAPNPGLARRILKQDILAKLASAGLPADDLQLPESILVRRRAQKLDREQVSAAILDALVRSYPDASVDVIDVAIPGVQIGTGPVELRASLPARFDPATSMFVRLEIRGDNFARTVFVQTTVRIETIQPVLNKTIRAQSEIHKEDIEWKPAPIAGTRAAVTSPDGLDGLEGMLAKRDLEVGQVLTADLVYAPVYIRKGETATVKATAGGVSISATMRAKTSGRYGESIVVEHLSGTGTTTARVIGPRMLEAMGGK